MLLVVVVLGIIDGREAKPKGEVEVNWQAGSQYLLLS